MRPYDPMRPVVCMDESTKQLLDEVRRFPVARAPRSATTQSIGAMESPAFLVFEPLAGWRKAQMTEQRTRRDWAHFIKSLLDERYPDCERVILVMDNLNPHSGASLYETLAPREALRLLRRLEFQYTPKHGSWLNMAEGEFSVLQKHCLDCRISDSEVSQQEIAAWQNPA